MKGGKEEEEWSLVRPFGSFIFSPKPSQLNKIISVWANRQFKLSKLSADRIFKPDHHIVSLSLHNTLWARRLPSMPVSQTTPVQSARLVAPPPLSIHPSVCSPIPPPNFPIRTTQSLSVEQDEGLQLLGNVSPVVKAVLDDGPGG